MPVCAHPSFRPTTRLLGMLLGIWLIGCAHSKIRPRGMNRSPAEGITQTDPKWADLWRNPPAAPTLSDKDAKYLRAPSVQAQALLCQLPVTCATNDAWALTDESLLPPEVRALWHANGLRVGVLPEAKWADFRAALKYPQPGALPASGILAQKLVTLTLRPFAEPLHQGDALPAHFELPLDTTLPPLARQRKLLSANSGDRMQLLAEALFQNRILTGLRLTPQLHRLDGRATFLLPDESAPKPWEKDAAGTIFAMLETPAWQPKAGQLLVVGLWQASPKKDAPPQAPAPSLGKALWVENATQVFLVLSTH